MYIIHFCLILSMLTVLWFDITRYIIPNWLVGLLLLLYPVALSMTHLPVDWKMAIVAMSAVLVVGYFIFAMKWMGGGDIKLITVCTLWVGLHSLPDFLFMVALLGGLFAVIVWVIRKVLPHIPIKHTGAWPRLLRDGEPIPYGVAIALGFMLMVWMGKVQVIL